MPDPMTVGTFVATALGAGAAEAAKDSFSGAAKAAYEALKARVARWASGDVEKLEAQAKQGKPVEGRRASHRRST